MVSNHPIHFTVDKVTHLMARSPYIKLARPLAFRKMKCVEQKANHIRYDGYHEWGCTSHQKLPQHRIMGKRVKLDRIGWKKSRSGGGGWCTSQKEGKRRRMIRFFKSKVKIFQDVKVVQNTKSKIRSSNNHPKHQPSIPHDEKRKREMERIRGRGRGKRTNKSRCFMPSILPKHVNHRRKHRETQEKEEGYSQMLHK